MGITREGLCDMSRLNEWLRRLLTERGADLFRSKGVLAVKGCEDRWGWGRRLQGGVAASS